MKLTAKQRAALEWLNDSGPWRAAWWGGYPHGRWPDNLGPRTYDSLRKAGAISMRRAKEWPDQIVSVTPFGKGLIAK